MASRKVLVAGGSGFIGRALVQTLEKKGYMPVVITRHEKESKNQISWKLLRQKGIPENTYAIVNLTGRNIADAVRRWSDSYKKEISESRIKSAEFLVNLINSSETAREPRVFVNCSAVGYYPPDAKRVYREDWIFTGERDPGNFAGRLCDSWELAARLAKNSPVRPVIVRTGLVLGRDGGLVASSFPTFWAGFGGPLGTGDQWFPWIHLQDMVGLIIHFLECEKISGPLNCVAPNICTNSQFSRAFSKALWRPAFFSMPKPILNFIFGEERADMMVTGQYVYPQKALDTGYLFKYPDIDSACKEFSRLFYTNDEKKRAPGMLKNVTSFGSSFAENLLPAQQSYFDHLEKGS